ncbi:hypothetical protein [Cerasicoccus frondis]|uniref:hypothetical protein n=1 Tax=Cerasicoccus frondis TaxID=490090 RepID=UPI0028528473|nr:hypothetical protein [Cerasicoccus frondis]
MGNSEQSNCSEILKIVRTLSAENQPITPPPAGPMLLWTGVGFAPLAPDDIQALRTLGLNQHLPLLQDFDETARTLDQAGAPLQLMEGLKRFPLPTSEGSYDFFPEKPQDSFNLASWRKVGELIRERLSHYQELNLTISSLWLDYEGYPFSSPFLNEQTPPSAQQVNVDDWPAYRRQFALNIASTYIAAPAREVYPHITTLNWLVNLSFPQAPIINALGQPTPSSGPSFFSHSNPYAYGNTLAYEKSELPFDLPQKAVDLFYLKLLIQHTSIDASNRQAAAPYIGSIPWVARIVRDSKNSEIPTMSRSAYREALRHLWLRDIDSMLIFNAPYLTPDEHQAEIQDACDVWRILEPFGSLLKDGYACELGFPEDTCNQVIWSGMADSQSALIHLTTWDNQTPSIAEITVWNKIYQIKMPKSGGKTVRIWRQYGSLNFDAITVLNAYQL